MSQPPPGSQTASQRSSPGELGGSDRSPAWRFGAADVCLAAAIGLAVLLVHDVPYLLHHSFWVDEAWVADTVRAPIGLTPSLSSSTPVGWTVLLRLVPFGGPQRLRLVPLAFAMLAAAAGYLFGYELRLTRYTTGILTGAAVLLSPAMLVRDDLKQYTAEAFAGLVLWVLVARIENEWRLRRLVAIAAVTSVGLLFANTVIFVGVAAMAALALECLVRRRWRRLAAVAGASAGMLAVSLVIYELLIRPQVTRNLAVYWAPYYVPRSASAAVSNIHLRLDQLAPYLGFRFLVLDLVLALAGIAALIWLRRFALAAMLPVILVVVIAASAAGKYPFGDLRTSTFWLVTVPLLMAVAVAAAGRWATAIDRRAPAVITAAALAVWVLATGPYIRSHELPGENVHSQVLYLDRHFRRGDVVIVSYAASYAFAYYYPLANPSFPADPIGPNAHVPAYPTAPWIVVMTNRRPVDVANALAVARAKVAAEGSRTHGRIWIVRSHLQEAEKRAWQRNLAAKQVRTIHVGHEPLLLYVPSQTARTPAG
jgi:hypothetical protein